MHLNKNTWISKEPTIIKMVECVSKINSRIIYVAHLLPLQFEWHPLTKYGSPITKRMETCQDLGKHIKPNKEQNTNIKLSDVYHI